MKNVFDSAVADDLKKRILRLNPDSERQWGRMTLSQTLAHCTSGPRRVSPLPLQRTASAGRRRQFGRQEQVKGGPTPLVRARPQAAAM